MAPSPISSGCKQSFNIYFFLILMTVKLYGSIDVVIFVSTAFVFSTGVTAPSPGLPVIVPNGVLGIIAVEVAELDGHRDICR